MIVAGALELVVAVVAVVAHWWGFLYIIEVVAVIVQALVVWVLAEEVMYCCWLQLQSDVAVGGNVGMLALVVAAGMVALVAVDGWNNGCGTSDGGELVMVKVAAV